MVHYEPLQDDEIRTLSLLPSVHTEEKICCTLSRRALEASPYLALSYVWGSPEPPGTIFVDGEQTSVTPNLFVALQRLRHATETICLWVDALCINQNNKEEKTTQVKRMGEIYNKADAVLMWLGEEKDDSNRAMELVQWLVDIGEAFVASADVDPRKETIERFVRLFKDSSFDEHWFALKRLFKRPYWTRVWIVQEALLAGQAFLCCGSARASWTRLMPAIAATKNWQWKSQSAAAKDALFNLALPQMELSERYLDTLVHGQRLSLLDALVMFRNRKAKDPRDHVYGVLSLAIHDGFEADYNKNVFDVYRDVVKYMVQRDQSLDVLSAVRHGSYMEDTIRNLPSPASTLSQSLASTMSQFNAMSELLEEASSDDNTRPVDQFSDLEASTQPAISLTDNRAAIQHISQKIESAERAIFRTLRYILPSWIPDWSYPYGETMYLLLNSPAKCHYRAGGETKPRVHFPNAKCEMIVDGIRFDILTAVSPGPPPLGTSTVERYKHAFKDDWKLWRDMGHPFGIYGADRGQQEAYLRTMVAARNPDGTKGSCTLSVPLLNFRYELGFIDTEEKSDKLRGPSTLDYKPIESMITFFRFCITGHGYMGRVPVGARRGDVVAVLFGARVPFLLRRYEDHDAYCLLGECCESI
jgi:hypothetical protein